MVQNFVALATWHLGFEQLWCIGYAYPGNVAMKTHTFIKATCPQNLLPRIFMGLPVLQAVF